MKTIPGVRVCIWDFDGTLYRQQPALWEEIRASEMQVVMEHTGWTKEKVNEEFYKIYGVTTPSGTQTTSQLANITNEQASIETSKYTDYGKYLKPDPELATMFGKLKNFQHYMLVNGTQESVKRGAKLLGLDLSVFREIVTSEIVGETKPGTKGFLYIISKTGLPAAAHMMIGDREAVDLVPAAALGIRTCLVWSDMKSNIVDVVLSDVYKVPDVLG